MKATFIIVIIFIYSCANNAVEDQFFIVPEYNELYLKDSIKYIPYDYYSQNNIIILDTSHLLYYHDNSNICGKGWSVNDPPIPIDFEQNPLEVYNNEIEVVKRINQSETKHKFVMLVSDCDTVWNSTYFRLKELINDEMSIHVVSTRKLTKDEEMAIQSGYLSEY